MVVDKVAAVPTLLLVIVRLGEDLVGEEVVRTEFEDQAETRTFEILHADVRDVLESLFIAIGDGLSKRGVFHSTEPEFGNSLHVHIRLFVFGLVFDFSLLSIFRLLLVLLFTSLDFLIAGLGLAIDDFRAYFVQRGKLGEVLLLEGEDLGLELGLELGVFLLHTFETIDAFPYRSRK